MRVERADFAEVSGELNGLLEAARRNGDENIPSLKRLGGRPYFEFFVARDGGKAVGFGVASVHDHSNLSDELVEGFLHWVVVHPGHRRKGVARKLAEARLNWLKERGVQTAFAVEGSEAGKKHLESLGFEKRGNRFVLALG